MADNSAKNRDAKANIIAKALSDDSFRKALLADPKAVLEQEFGVKLPNDVNINVLEESQNNAYLVIPASGGEELSEDELAQTTQMSDCWLTCTSCSEWTSFEPGESAEC